jgi:hypothetical protein
MRYFFWISRFSPRVQLGLMIGLFVGYRVLVGLLSGQPQLAPLLWTVVIAYGAFAFSTWFARPLFNLLLLLHPFGRLALSRDDRRSARWVGTALLAALVLIGTAVAWPSKQNSLIAFHGASSALTVMCTFATPAPWPRRGMLIYMAAVLLLAAISMTLLLLPPGVFADSPRLLEAARGVFGFIDRLMVLNPLASTLLPGVLAQYQPRRN